MTFKRRFKAKAFTLIEVSVVILIIGIMLAGTFIGTRIIAKSRLAAAESLARSSPVPGIKDNMLWLETSLSASIDGSQASDGKAVTSWYDQSSNAAKPLVVAVGTGPTYANTINHVHAIKFDGSTANYLQISDASFLNGTDYTIMVLEKRQSSASNNYFIGETSGSPNTSLALGYGSDSTVIHAQGNQSYTTGAAVSSYASSTDKPRQFTFVHSSTAGNSTYINGILAAQDATKTAHLSGITTLAIGKGYTGEIGEIAIYARALKPEERQPVEDYAGKKWTRSINRASAPSGSCVGYTITDSGCDLASATCSISQAGISATVAAASSSTSIACNQTNYSGSVSYTCISGTASVSGSCTSTIPCTLSLAGSTNTSSVASGATGSMTCDVTGYAGTVSYSCSNGTASYGGACSCNTAGGYVASGGSCVLGSSCSTTAVTGVTTPTSVAHMATGSLTCNSASNYTGTVTYNCNNGSLNPSGSCTCATGYANPNCASCASGYVASGGTCVLGASCSTTSVTGVSTPTTVAHLASGSLTCNATGYTGSVTYTCSNGTLTPTGACTCASGYTMTGGVCVSSGTSCTGGTITTPSGLKVHTFTSNGTFTCTAVSGTAKVLVVGGGGAGGSAQESGAGGGGGGGGVVYAATYPIAATSYSITVGSGGASVNYLTNGNNGIRGISGGDSIFGTITATGGGGGGAYPTSLMTGLNGGSGGGAGGGFGGTGGTGTQATQTNATNFYKNNGGNSASGGNYTGGGGGGAGGAGGASAVSTGGAGGAGISNSTRGSAILYGAGGGASGGAVGSNGGAGGSGGGGAGGNGSSTIGTAGSSASDTAGNGGGGANKNASGAGSNGIVIISYTYP